MNRILLGLSVLLCTTACGHGHGHDSEHQKPSGHEASHDVEGGELKLALDDGKKWPVDEHTRQSAARLAELVEDSQTIGSTEDAHALATALDEELDVLVKGCTMTGAAHDQLHVFLMALIPKVETLKNDETGIDDLQQVKQEIDSLLEAYETHFETAPPAS